MEFTDAWGGKYPAIVRLWEAAWAEFVPILQFDVEIRKIVCTTNAIENINTRIRKAVRAREHFPTDQAALKCVYLAVTSPDPAPDASAGPCDGRPRSKPSTSPSTAGSPPDAAEKTDRVPPFAAQTRPATPTARRPACSFSGSPTAVATTRAVSRRARIC